MRRPFGVTVIGIIALLGSILSICYILAFTGSALIGGTLGIIGTLAGIFLLVGPLLQLIFAIGVFDLQKWAWYLGLISSGITVTGVIINLIAGASILSAIWGSTIPVIIFFYLLTPKVRAAFGI